MAREQESLRERVAAEAKSRYEVMKRPPIRQFGLGLFVTDRLRTAQRALPQAEIDAAPDAMVRNRRAGELLSCIRVLEVRLPFDVATLLRKAFEAKDSHTRPFQFRREVLSASAEVPSRRQSTSACPTQSFWLYLYDR